MKPKGIDITYHSGKIDFKKVKNDGINFIIPRDGWGMNNIDPKLVEFAAQAKEAGVEVPGVYHFIYGINKDEIIKNAECAIANVQAAGLPTTTIIWCDLEYDTIDNARDYRNTEITNEMAKEFAITFCDTVKAAGYPTGVYTNKDYITRIYGTDFLNKYDLWLADISGNDEPYYPCVYRQSNWATQVDGISVVVDADEYYGNYTAGTAKVSEDTKKEVVEMTKNVSIVASAMPVIAKGKTGEGVKTLQKILKELGYYVGTIDGDAGAVTDSAIRKFQTEHSLDVDGSFGPKSWACLLSL